MATLHLAKMFTGIFFDNFDDSNMVANVARIILSVTMFLTFPLDYFVIRYSMQRLIQRLGSKHGWWVCGCLGDRESVPDAFTPRPHCREY